MDETTERRLIEQAAQGEWQAFTELMAYHQQHVYRLAYRLTGNDADAESVTQDVFVNAHRGLAGFEARSRLRTWLLGIAIRAAFAHRSRTRKDRNTVSLSDNALPERDARRARMMGPVETVEHKEFCELLQDNMMRLPADMLSALTLVVFDHLSYREAGHALECSEDTVAWRIRKARQLLRKAMAPHMET